MNDAVPDGLDHESGDDARPNVGPGQPLAVVVGAGGMAMAIARRLGHSYRVLLVSWQVDQPRNSV